jgi:RND superfamily putative drug exporter
VVAPILSSVRGRKALWISIAFVLLWLVIAVFVGSQQSKVSTVQTNDNTAFLPQNAESTAELNLNKKFGTGQTTPAIVVYGRPTGLTAADRAKIQSDAQWANTNLAGNLAGPAAGPVVSADGKAAQFVLQFSGSGSDVTRGLVTSLRNRITSGDPGLEAHVTGPIGIFADLSMAFQGINGILLLVTGGVILAILLVVYRSPLLPVLVLVVAGFALTTANGLVYYLAKAHVITLSGQSQGILDVLVLGAGTDYALLMVSRYREELRRHDSRFEAMWTAWKAAMEPILASGGTVILGLLCLLVSQLSSNRGLGPVGAIGIATALLAMLTLLPAVLALLGRAVFWPFRPHYGSIPAEEHGIWSRVARLVGRRPRTIWITVVVLLGILVGGISQLQSNGIPQTDSFSTQVDSTRGQNLLAAHFPPGSGNPAQIIANAGALNGVVAAARSVPGVALVEPFTGAPASPAPGAQAGPPKVVDGLIRVDATLSSPADSVQSGQTIQLLRDAVHAVPGANAKVGGFSATSLDVQTTSQRDRTVIIPLVLAVVFVVLCLLLRAIVAPLILVVTVALSFLATLGVCGVMFRHVFGFAGADSAFPLFAFVFLVALGVDYNIFLMTRVREEVAKRGHRAGTLTGLAVTGGVITSAGIVLAATFSALAVLPLVFLSELAFAVAFGVLLDALVVRSLLVPAVTVDLGRPSWWPGKLRHTDP